MIIGEWYNVTQVVAVGRKCDKQKTYGKCVWIHQERRFCVLQFDGGIRECFSPFDLGVM